MERKDIESLLEMLEYNYNETNINQLCEGLKLIFVSDLNKMAREISYKYKKKPQSYALMDFISGKSKVITECEYCKNTGTIGVGKIQLAKSRGVERWFTLPGSSVKCPKCYNSNSLRAYLRMAGEQKIYKITIIKDGNTEIKYEQGTAEDLQETISDIKSAGHTGCYKIIDDVLSKILDRLKLDNKYPLHIWIPEYVNVFENLKNNG